GHATLPGTTAREDAVIAHLREKFDHVSAERALSGPGLENLHAAIAAIDGIAVSSQTAAEITQQALDRSCPVSVAAVDMFCAMLGTVAGDLALMFRARGGVYIGGGGVAGGRGFLGQSGVWGGVWRGGWWIFWRSRDSGRASARRGFPSHTLRVFRPPSSSTPTQRSWGSNRWP